MLQPTMLHVAHSILSAMERYRTKHAVVMLLARVMCAELVRAHCPLVRGGQSVAHTPLLSVQAIILCLESADTVPVWG